DLAGLRLQGHDEAAAGAAQVEREGGHDLLEAAARDDQLAVGEDRRGEEDVERVAAGELLAPCVELPALLPGRPVQVVEPAADVAEEYGIPGDERRAEDASFGRLEAGAAGLLVVLSGLGRFPPLAVRGVAVGPAELAVGRQLVEGRVGGRAEINVAVH